VNGWKVVSLGEIATVNAGSPAPQGKEPFEGGHLPFIRTSDVGAIHVGEIRTTRDQVNAAAGTKLKLFPAGTVLFPKSGASTFTNHRVLMRCDAYVASHLAAIKANASDALDEYLFYYLQTVDARDLVQDTNYPSLNLKAIAAIPVPLPPLGEQRQIVATLDEALGEIGDLKRNRQAKIDALAAVKNSILTELLQPKPGTAGSGRAKLGDVVTLEYGKPLPPAERVEGGPIPVLGANGVKAACDRALVEGPGIVVGRKGSAGAVNLTNGPFWPLDVTYFVNHDPAETDLMFIYFVLQSLELPSLARGVKPGLNRNDAYALPIYVPPLDEQRRIVATLDEATLAIDSGKSAANEELVLADAMAASLMTELLTAA
jgi:type I restriction enzyme S subunit